MNKKTGFTLAEVLITLVIIGVIAAMTVPTLMTNTNSQEYRSALKKSIAMLNQALSMQYALDGTRVSDFTNATSVMTNVFSKRLNVISTAVAATTFGTTANSSTAVFYTADGMKFGLAAAPDAGGCAADGSTTCYTIYIDVNGDKAPNTNTTSSTKPLDVYTGVVYSQRVVPYNTVTQEVMFDK